MKHATTMLALLVCLACCNMPAWAQAQPGEIIVLQSNNAPLPSLRDAAEFTRNNPPVLLFNEIPNFSFREDTRAVIGGENFDQDPLLQEFNPSAPTSVLTQFDGSDNVDNGANITPPDTDGDVSSDAVDRYVQMINWVTTVFDKSGNIAPGGSPFFSNAFWAGAGGICESNNNGDPIIIYDETAERWLVSQFAFNSTSAPPWRQCVAVSQTSDPLGAYNRYEFNFDAIGFPDYPKHGVVTDDVTLFAHLFIGSYVGSFVGTIDKAAMYAGTPATMVGINTGTSEGGFVAGDLDDAAGTAGTVGAFFATDSNTSGLFDVWEVVPDYATPGNTTVSRIARVPIAPFDSDLCAVFRERCIPHPGSGDDLETLSDRLMHRLQLRDFGTHLSMVTARTVDAGSGRAGIRWYELRSTDNGATWSLHQEGTHAPADGLHRWMPSIAMNANGDIGLGYMVSDATTPVEVRVTGQTAASSGTGTLDADEAVCRAGVAGSDWSGRSGDYSATNVDPDSDTFWHTNEFGRSTAFRGWGTAVCEFQISQPAAFTIDLKRVFIKDNGAKKAVIRWDENAVLKANIDFYYTQDPALPAPDGNPDKRVNNDGKVKLKIKLPGNGPFNIQSCQKNTDNVCSNVVSADFTGAPIIGPEDPDYYDDPDELDAAAKGADVPSAFAFHGHYPNPFNPTTTIQIDLPERAQVQVTVYDVLGRAVLALPVQTLEAGARQGLEVNASALSSGTYVYRLTAEMDGDVQVATGRMILVK